MNKGFKIAGVATLLLSTWATVEAIPLYYTVSGSISQYHQNDEAGIMQEMGFSTGDKVSYTFLIDIDSTITSSWSTMRYNYFDVSLISGSVFGSDNTVPGSVNQGAAPWSGFGRTNYVNASNQHYEGESYYGETSIVGYAPNGLITLINEEEYFLNGEVTQLQPGDFFSAYNYTLLYNEAGQYSRFEVDTLRIASISSEYSASTSVPEPGVLWLFGAGLAGIVYNRSKKQKMAKAM